MHLSENVNKLKEQRIEKRLTDLHIHSANVETILLPFYKSFDEIPSIHSLLNDLNSFIERTDNNSTIVVITSPIFAACICSQLNNNVNLKLWIAVKLENPIKNNHYLTEQHSALLVLTRYKGSLRHTKTRIGYTYCLNCQKTTKDYGGKKHLYHEFGTLISDVWRDIAIDYNDYPQEIINRLADLFGLPEYNYINIYDQRNFYQSIGKERIYRQVLPITNDYSTCSTLLNGDSLELLKNIPENSVDFCFADPPYNLNKKYENWNDEIDIEEYFIWCDKWLSELARILKPGRTLAILNIPQWCIRHFKYLKSILDYQDWIVWEGLSYPVRMIMPSHYAILCFSKGKPRILPGINRQNNSLLERKACEALLDKYCIRQGCMNNRKILKIGDTEFPSNLWSDIHRLKHNSRRVDHPTQLPPTFMYRLISLFTNEHEMILDPFNGSGTTTLAAHQLNRNYIGIELSDYYHNIAKNRHKEIDLGFDPFKKNNIGGHKAKNSRVMRLKKQKYKVSKKILQLEIKNIAKRIGHIPTKEEVASLCKYPFEFYKDYFISWGEATAAARTTGMTEYKDKSKYQRLYENQKQLKLFERTTYKHKKTKKAMSSNALITKKLS